MNRCLQLAGLGSGLTAPNPMVGCVIVHAGKVIAEGYHHEYGGPHAEKVAIRKVRDASILKESTLYVNLEPCSHFGKTPPCADLIIGKGIPEVIIANRDPNPLVAGKGIERLEAHGVRVSMGILEKEGAWLNRRFFTYQTVQRPYVILKWAVSEDGFMDKSRKPGEDPHINWITGPGLKQLVHKWRTEEAAILVGGRTLVNDNPMLTPREWAGTAPLRIGIESKGSLPVGLNLMDGEASTVLLTTPGGLKGFLSQARIPIIETALPEDPSVVLRLLFDRQVLSVIIEGGRKTLQRFIDAGLWDEARVLTGNCMFEEGLRGPEITGIPGQSIRYGDEWVSYYYNSRELNGSN